MAATDRELLDRQRNLLRASRTHIQEARATIKETRRLLIEHPVWKHADRPDDRDA